MILTVLLHGDWTLTHFQINIKKRKVKAEKTERKIRAELNLGGEITDALRIKNGREC